MPIGLSQSSSKMMPGCERGISRVMVFSPSVVINNFNLVGVPVKPHKAQSPLIVDANAVLTSTIADQSLQSVARRDAQEIQRGRSVQLLQLA
jgi:hypothetical protein